MRAASSKRLSVRELVGQRRTISDESRSGPRAAPLRDTCSTSRISRTARTGSRSASFDANSALSTINESVCPSTSWRSRAMRSRSATAARRSISS